MNQLVSVVIPVFNTEEHLERCVSSLIHQTYAPLEIVLVDDGSTDKSGELCDSFAAENPTIRVFHTSNCGASHARNIGIEESKGDYLIFVDSDDYVDEQMVEELAKDMNRNNSDLSISALEKSEQEDFCIDLKPENESGILFLSEKHLIFGPTQKLYKSKHAKEIVFPENVKYGEDLLFNLDYLRRIKTVSYINKCFYHYCRRDNTLSTKVRWNMFDNDIFLHESLMKWYDEIGVLGNRIKTFLYNRILDTAINSICLTFLKECPLNQIEIEKLIRRIITNELVVNSLQIADTSKYARWQIDLIKQQKARALSCIALIKRAI